MERLTVVLTNSLLLKIYAKLPVFLAEVSFLYPAVKN